MSATPTRAAIASVCAAQLLGGLKAYAAWTTGSVAMLASLSDSVLDLIASLVTLAGVRIAAPPAHANRSEARPVGEDCRSRRPPPP